MSSAASHSLARLSISATYLSTVSVADYVHDQSSEAFFHLLSGVGRSWLEKLPSLSYNCRDRQLATHRTKCLRGLASARQTVAERRRAAIVYKRHNAESILATLQRLVRHRHGKACANVASYKNVAALRLEHLLVCWIPTLVVLPYSQTICVE